MTEKIFDTDSHVHDFTAVVTACTREEDRFAVELDRTAFFPGGGGQKADRGVLKVNGETIPVLEMAEKEDHVFHYIGKELPIGTRVEGSIDWEMRFTNMQQHSGEHLLSGIAYAWKGAHNVGFHMADTFTTVDFDVPFTQEELDKLELEANWVVYENQPVSVFYPSKEELSHLSYRSKKELTGAVRLVKVGDSDLCACCAPHVRKTGEIGLIKIVHWENYKGGVRLTILCGQRAFRDYQKKDRFLSDLAQQMSTSGEKLGHALEKEKKELEEVKARNVLLCRQAARTKAASLVSQAAVSGGSIGFIETLLDQTSLRAMLTDVAQAVNGTVAVLCPRQTGIALDSPQAYLYILTSAHEDVRPKADLLKQRFQARGGGSSQMAQGSVQAGAGEIFRALDMTVYSETEGVSGL